MLLERRAATLAAVALCISPPAPALAAWVDREKEISTAALCVQDLSCARRREADRAVAAERKRARELEMLEDERLDRCRFAGKSNFEQCFFYGSDVAPDRSADARAPAAEDATRRRGPPTW